MYYYLFKILQPIVPKDTYITWDNLYEKDAEPIDGWTMFQYLQKNGYRSKYIIRKDSPFYKKLKDNNQIKDVVAIKIAVKIFLIRFFLYYYEQKLLLNHSYIIIKMEAGQIKNLREINILQMFMLTMVSHT